MPEQQASFLQTDEGAKLLDRTPLDPWAHRSQGMRCQSCMWFVIKAGTGTRTSVCGSLGRCRRHAPTMSGYPVVFGEDWCGDHKLTEEARS